MKLDINSIIKTKSGERVKILKRVKDKRGSGFDMITCEFIDEPFDDNGKHVVIERMASQVQRGILVNPYTKSVLGVGYSGEIVKGENVSLARDKWYSMIERCEKDGYAKIHNEWYNFGKFYTWLSNQIGWECYNIDKDFSQFDVEDKIYSPETCIMIPQSINVCITDREDKYELPVGVAYVRNPEKVESTISIMNENGDTINYRLGRFLNTTEGITEAFIFSKIAREHKLKVLSEILLRHGYIDIRTYNIVTNFRFSSKYANMDIVNMILRKDKYYDDIERFLLTHNEFSVRLNEISDILKSIPLEKLTPLHKNMNS